MSPRGSAIEGAELDPLFRGTEELLLPLDSSLSPVGGEGGGECMVECTGRQCGLTSVLHLYGGWVGSILSLGQSTSQLHTYTKVALLLVHSPC